MEQLSAKKKSNKFDQDGFKTLSTILMKVNNISKGIHEYVPIFFDNFMYSVAHTMIHSTLMSNIFFVERGNIFFRLQI